MQITSSQTQLVILPPARFPAPLIFKNIETDSRRYDQMLAAMQRLRGAVYLRDGAIQADQLAPDRRHKLAVDEHSWHVLLVDGSSHVGGCLRYLEEEKTSRFDDLWIRQSALARCPVWGTKFRRAVEKEMAQASLKRIGFGEVGGWAVREDRRLTADPLRMVLATCGLFRLLGGCAGLATATVRHGSAAILRRIGLAPLTVDGQEIPSYYDPNYRCQMEALRFDSDFPSPRYAAAIDELSSRMETTPVICRATKAPEWCGRPPVIELPGGKPRPAPVLQPVVLRAG
jgi:hypothetical protein